MWPISSKWGWFMGLSSPCISLISCLNSPPLQRCTRRNQRDARHFPQYETDGGRRNKTSHLMGSIKSASQFTCGWRNYTPVICVWFKTRNCRKHWKKRYRRHSRQSASIHQHFLPRIRWHALEDPLLSLTVSSRCLSSSLSLQRERNKLLGQINRKFLKNRKLWTRRSPGTMNGLLPQLCRSETSGVINLMEILYKTKSLFPFETLIAKVNFPFRSPKYSHIQKWFQARCLRNQTTSKTFKSFSFTLQHMKKHFY